MDPDPPVRLSHEESFRWLQGRRVAPEGPVPPIPSRRPLPDDEDPLGVTFFRTSLGDVALKGVTLPRTFFGRSEIGPMSCEGSDLSESTLSWLDFVEVDFSDRDLRGFHFKGANLFRAKLTNAGLGRSHFAGCDFTAADMRGAKLTYAQGVGLGSERISVVRSTGTS